MFEKNHEIIIKAPSRLKPLIGILLVILAVAGYVFIARPFSVMVDDLAVNVLTKEKEVTDLRAEIEYMKGAQKELELSTEVSRLEVLKTIPRDMEQEKVIRNLVDIAETYDVTLNSLGFGKGVSSKEGISSLKITTSVEGGYEDLLRFLAGIEQGSRLIKVNSISVQVKELEGTQVERATFSLSMEAFFQSK